MLWVKSLLIVFIANGFVGRYRRLNEAPFLLMLATVALAGVKPY